MNAGDLSGWWVSECMCVCVLTKAINTQHSACLFAEEGCNADVSCVDGLCHYKSSTQLLFEGGHHSPSNIVTLSVTEGKNYIHQFPIQSQPKHDLSHIVPKTPLISNLMSNRGR